MFCSSSEEMVVSFTIISKVAVITQVSINKKGADPLLGVSLNLNKMFNLRWDQKTTFKLQKCTVLLSLLTKQDLDCNDFLPRNGRTKVNCFLEANKYTSFWTYKLSRCKNQ